MDLNQILKLIPIFKSELQMYCFIRRSHNSKAKDFLNFQINVTIWKKHQIQRLSQNTEKKLYLLW